MRYFFVDSHAVEHADPRPLFGINAPLYCPSGVAAFGRHPLTSKLVWSNNVGYPADYNYREYYRDIGFDLDQHYLEPYQYAEGIRTPHRHQVPPHHRAGAGQALVQPGLGPGHRRAPCAGLRGPLPRSGRARAARGCRSPRCSSRPMTRSCSATGGSRARSGFIMSCASWPAAGRSWPARRASTWLRTRSSRRRCRRRAAGARNGYNEHWVNPKTEWMWRPLHEAAARMPRRSKPTAPRRPTVRTRQPGGPGPCQAGRELMLAQSSDWPFIITNGTTEEYARRRFHDHLHRFHDLLHAVEHRKSRPPSWKPWSTWTPSSRNWIIGCSPDGEVCRLRLIARTRKRRWKSPLLCTNEGGASHERPIPEMIDGLPNFCGADGPGRGSHPPSPPRLSERDRPATRPPARGLRRRPAHAPAA